MAPSGGGINGLAVTVTAGGLLLVYSGIKNVPVVEGLREIARGRIPTPTPPKVSDIKYVPAVIGAAGGASSTGGTGSGSDGGIGGGSKSGVDIANAARKHLGAPYKFGATGPAAFDCSGLVVYVLRTDLGMPLPAAVRRVRDFVRWPGAVTVPRDQTSAGDLVCWDFVHMGIAIDNTRMIHAPTWGQPVQIGTIWSNPAPIIRRVKR